MRWYVCSFLVVSVSLLAPVHANEPIGCQVRAKFSSEGSLSDAVTAEIEQAKSTVLLALYGFNNPLLAESLIKVAKRGVAVKIKIDAAKSEERKEARIIQQLRSAGVQVRSVAADGRNHNKFAVIDQRKVVTGSYNWTIKAEGNWENLLFLDCPALARQYEEEWEKIE